MSTIFNLLNLAKSSYNFRIFVHRLLNLVTFTILINILTGCTNISSTPQSIPTATNIPLLTVTFLPTATSTLLATATHNLPAPATATSTQTPRPQPTAPPRPTPVPTTEIINGSITLNEPLDPVLQGVRTFRWTTDVTLGQNQMFEMVFWPVGTDPMQQGFGPVGAHPEKAVRCDLDKAAANLPTLLIAGHDYAWGVLLIEVNPYRRLQYLGGGQRFRFEYSGGGGGSGGSSGDGPKPTSTPRG